MPYSKKGYRKRTYKGRKRGNTLAKKAYNLAKKAYKAPELKYDTNTITPTSVSGTGSITGLDTISAGTGQGGRIGDTIIPKSVHYRMTLKLHASATDTLIRMIIFRWIAETPSAPSDILQTVTVTSFKSADLRYQSQILRDQTFRLSTAEKPELFIRGKVRLGSKRIAYPTASNVANRNGIYVLFVSDEAVNTPTITFEQRLYYTDP